MPEMKETPVRTLDPAQATELALLVDLEARWENLRKTPFQASEAGDSMQDLHRKQKAYDAFRAQLVAYNKLYMPAHVPELLLNTPSRLGIWCRRMRDLHLVVQHDAACGCPISLVAKAHWWADRIGLRLHKPRVTRSTPPDTMAVAIQDLEALSRWCDDLDGIDTLGGQPVPPLLAPTQSS